MTFIPCCFFLLAVCPPSEEVDPYDSALVAAVHRFVSDGELDHLKAILEKHPNLVDSPEHFRQPRKPVRTDPFTPLQVAAYFGSEKIAAYLISRRANVNVADGQGWTPLHLAANGGHLSVVKLLVTNGADRNARRRGSLRVRADYSNAPSRDRT